MWDRVAEAGLRPEDFLDRPADALRGATPRSYLAAKPLVHAESRVAVRDVLRGFAAVATPRAQPVQGMEGVEDTPGARRMEEAQPSDADARPEAATREMPCTEADTTAARPAQVPVVVESPGASPRHGSTPRRPMPPGGCSSPPTGPRPRR
ncbi:hypothetical protein ACR6C2_40185 [Streptomyces sp. INA 01156]